MELKHRIEKQARLVVHFKLKPKFIEAFKSQDIESAWQVLTQMSKNIQREDGLLEYLSVYLNKAVLLTKKQEWVSVVSQCLKGLRIIKLFKGNLQRYAEFCKEITGGKAKLLQMEKR